MLICCYFKVYLQICVIPLFVQNCHFSPKKIKHLVATLQKNNIECIWSKSHVTSLFILLFIKSQYTVLHILFVLPFLFYCTFYSLFLFFFFFTYIYIYARVVLL